MSKRILSISRAPGQLASARAAGFNRVELFTKGISSENMEAKIAEAQRLLKEHSLSVGSVVIPKSSTLADFKENARLTIAFASGVGAKIVVADYPAFRGGEYRKKEREGADIVSPAALGNVRGLLKSVPHPFEVAEALSELKKDAASSKVKILIESTGGSALLYKPLGFKAFERVARASHGLVLDLEHVAQAMIAQPVEEVYNPATRFLSNRGSEEDAVLVRSFYQDYGNHMDARSKRAFQDFLEAHGKPGEEARFRSACTRLLALTKPGLRGFGKEGATPKDLQVKPSKWVYGLFVKAWGSLPIKHVHLTGGHLGERLAPSETVRTSFGTSDLAFEHAYEIETPRGEPIILGSKPGQSLYEYLHAKMGGRLYANKPWHEFARDLLDGRKATVNFEIEPKLVRPADLKNARNL
ncbi:MAG: hypothetical protein WC607_01345 [Candidatus Micrarchaeia archaeon]